jgi:branched-subunit amino acid aminotransferase/4-amino-4-deoxychorismate lyase
VSLVVFASFARRQVGYVAPGQSVLVETTPRNPNSSKPLKVTKHLLYFNQVTWRASSLQEGAIEEMLDVDHRVRFD